MEPDVERVRTALRISCADAVELVTEDLEGTLSRADQERFTTHLHGCEACAVYVDQLRATIRVVAATAQVETTVDPDVLADLLERFRDTPPRD